MVREEFVGVNKPHLIRQCGAWRCTQGARSGWHLSMKGAFDNLMFWLRLDEMKSEQIRAMVAGRKAKWR